VKETGEEAGPDEGVEEGDDGDGVTGEEEGPLLGDDEGIDDGPVVSTILTVNDG
jgi:hypothetical protein